MEEPKKLLPLNHHKIIPAAIEANVLKALSFFPELKEAKISFIIKPFIKSSVMQAQPVFYTLLLPRKYRRYRINISGHFRLIHEDVPILDLPGEVMIGWIGHELGHLLDYEGMTNIDLVKYGYKYLVSETFIKHAEMVADSLAVERGMGNYIVTTKRFILDHAHLPQSYKNKISRLYLSPDVIVEKVKQLEEKEVNDSLSPEEVI